MSEYDLLLQGGSVIDPATGRQGRWDVAFAGGKVAAIEERIQAASAARVEAVTGLWVTPGLIDMHAHVFYGVGESLAVDAGGLARGVTTVADGGSAGASTFGAFRRIVSGDRTRVLAWLNLSSIGQADTRVGELMSLLHADVEAAVETAQAQADLIVGLKARLSTYVVGMTCKPVLTLLRQAADACGLPVMVHVGETGEPLAEIFPFLRPGDVVSHALTGRRNGLLQADGRIIPEAFAARRAGILFDAARGRTHLAFPVLRAAVEQDLLPDTLSTDITRFSAADPDFGLPLYGSQLLAMGVPLPDVIARMTWNAARVMRREDLGRLQVGGPGDATVLRIESGQFTVRDADGRTLAMDRRLVAVGVVREGEYVAL